MMIIIIMSINKNNITVATAVNITEAQKKRNKILPGGAGRKGRGDNTQEMNNCPLPAPHSIAFFVTFFLSHSHARAQRERDRRAPHPPH